MWIGKLELAYYGDTSKGEPEALRLDAVLTPKERNNALTDPYNPYEDPGVAVRLAVSEAETVEEVLRILYSRFLEKVGHENVIPALRVQTLIFWEGYDVDIYKFESAEEYFEAMPEELKRIFGEDRTYSVVVNDKRMDFQLEAGTLFF